MRDRGDRWTSEASFFDNLAERQSADAPGLDARVLRRYARSHRAWFNKEYRFGVIGEVEGKRVLDVGCGTGDNSLLLANYGAEVTGVDISPKSVELARRRAEAAGVAGRCRFICAPLEVTSLGERAYDIVWGDGVLHHVIAELDAVMAALSRAAKPGALFLFSEPVAFLRALRWLRRWVPIHTEATPDERPLEPSELELLRRYLPDMVVRRYGLAGRFNGLILGGPYEHAPALRRAIAGFNCILDQAVLSLPLFSSLASMAVVIGHTPALSPVAPVD